MTTRCGCHCQLISCSAGALGVLSFHNARGRTSPKLRASRRNEKGAFYSLVFLFGGWQRQMSNGNIRPQRGLHVAAYCSPPIRVCIKGSPGALIAHESLTFPFALLNESCASIRHRLPEPAGSESANALRRMPMFSGTALPPKPLRSHPRSSEDSR
jgi:hypothetical protein